MTSRATLYGLPEHIFFSIWDEQSGCCAICYRHMIPRGRTSLSVVVDHDHVTKDVRGLLCNDCNTGLGKFGDDPDRLSNAKRYLSQHRLRRAG